MYYYIWYIIASLCIFSIAAFGLPKILERFFCSNRTSENILDEPLVVEKVVKIDITGKTKVALVRAEDEKFLLVIGEGYTTFCRLNNKHDKHNP